MIHKWSMPPAAAAAAAAATTLHLATAEEVVALCRPKQMKSTLLVRAATSVEDL